MGKYTGESNCVDYFAVIIQISVDEIFPINIIHYEVLVQNPLSGKPSSCCCVC